MEHVHDSPQVNVFCAVSSCKFYGPLFFAEPTVTGINYLDMLQLWLMPQLQEDSKDFIFQQDGALQHFHFEVRAHLSAIFPVVGLGVLLTMTLLFLPGLHGHLIEHPAIFFSYGVTSRIVCTCPCAT